MIFYFKWFGRQTRKSRWGKCENKIHWISYAIDTPNVDILICFLTTYSSVNRFKYPNLRLSFMYLSSYYKIKKWLTHLFCYCLTEFDLVWFETRSSHTEEPDWDNVIWFKLPFKVKSSFLSLLNDRYHATAHWQQIVYFSKECIIYRYCFHGNGDILFYHCK